MTYKQSLRPNGLKTDKTEKKKKHGGYRNLRSYQTTTLIYDLTVEFCKSYLTDNATRYKKRRDVIASDYKSDKTNLSYRTIDQMVQAARSGRQNIAEGSEASSVSKKSEIKLVGVARASLEELLIDYEDFLRQRSLSLWDKDNPSARTLRALAYKTDKTYETYRTYLRSPEEAANCLICLIHQANYLLDRQLESLKKAFVEEGGFTENLFKTRLEKRRSNL